MNQMSLNSERSVRIHCFLIALCASFAANAAPPTQKATFVSVHKAAHEMFLYDEKVLLAKFPIALGQTPVGHKEREGDRKTPEGLYVLDYKNPNSRYHRSIHVSYPNTRDKNRAKTLGVAPGGDIMIHGQPNGSKYAADELQRYDWTDGCIAVTNEQMDQIWAMIDVPVPIQIVP